MGDGKDNKMIAKTGGAAVAEALRQIAPDVMPVYPITPQTPIIETYAKFVADGAVETEMIEVESEHSAISAAVGSSAAGARTVTATSSQGLALMHEVLYIASGMRLPILMPVAARALSAPINIHGDHSDVMGARDAGWIQVFCENPQEAYDKTLIGMRLAEKAGLPVMVIMDGFNTSHSVENLEILDDAVAKEFVGEYEPKESLLNVDDPRSFGTLALQGDYFEFKIQQEEAMRKAKEYYSAIAEEYARVSGRKYGLFELYGSGQAKKLLVLAGSAAGTAKDAVDAMAGKGEGADILKIELFRPFPEKEFAEALSKYDEIIVLDRALSMGTEPPFRMQAEALVRNGKTKIRGYVYGLGGRDIFKDQIKDAVSGKNKEEYIR